MHMNMLEDLIRVRMDERLRKAELARRQRQLTGNRPERSPNPPRSAQVFKAREAREPNTAAGRRVRAGRFARHYLEMLVAMVVGMIVLSPAWDWLRPVLNASALLDRPDVGALVMATNMTIAMSAWMRYRGHGPAPIAEMAAAMYLPFVILFLPLWAGLISGGTLMVAGHLLMLPAMAVAMLFRPDEYTHNHAGQPVHAPECS